MDVQHEANTTKVFNILCFGASLTEGYYNFGKNFHPYTIRLENNFKAAGYEVQVRYNKCNCT